MSESPLSPTSGAWSRVFSWKLWVVVGLLLASAALGRSVSPTWSVQQVVVDTRWDASGRLVYDDGGDWTPMPKAVPWEEATVTPEALTALSAEADARGETLDENQTTQFVVIPPDPGLAVDPSVAGEVKPTYAQLQGRASYGPWALMPAVVAIALCVLLREPLTALFAGVVTGAFLTRRYDITDGLLIPALQQPGVAEVLLLYTGLLGGLLGIWSYTGSARAFAEAVARRFVRGPRSAKLVGWGLGLLFFQGGTISTIMVGSTTKPVADREKVSHEELSYVVDSTASPIAAVIAFNSWPAYVQALIFVPGVVFLADQESRLAFYFASTLLSFYGIFAVLGTFLLCIEKLPKWAMGPAMHAALRRSRETGQLDRPGAKPLQAKELDEEAVNAECPKDFLPAPVGFVIPLAVLIVTVIATFIATGSPNTNWAFGLSLLVASAIALLRGLDLVQLIDAVSTGVKSVAVAALILVLAITLGRLSREVGADVFLVQLLGDAVPYWILPMALVFLTMGISFATGTSWGTYAVVFPLGMPLAWMIADAQALEHAQLYMMVCFAAILNGSLFGDQCSPISDTTVLSAMVTGTDLMDHVKTQIWPAFVAMGFAILCWTVLTLVWV